jgi:predicted AlkP superfamily pyrophosphatase or phosphodiesterase
MNHHNPIVLILIDGMRPDGLQQADTPTLETLMANGSYTLAAQTVMPSISLPCISSLFWGVPPERHGILDNVYQAPQPAVPGLIDLIHKSGRTTYSFYNWEELRDLARPGRLDEAVFLNNLEHPDGNGDMELASLAADRLRRQPADFTFVYLGVTDIAGHHAGWMSPRYLEAIARADRAVELIRRALPSESLLIITADHGGHERSHGSDRAEDLRIPLILHGPGIPVHYSLPAPVNITDIAPTILSYLDLPIPAEWIGKPLFGSDTR